MTEFINQVVPPRFQSAPGDGFDAMGKPIPLYRCTAALEHCRQIGLDNADDAMACVSGMAEQLKRDQPYEALAVGMRYLDLTGTYRVMAVLLTAPDPNN